MPAWFNQRLALTTVFLFERRSLCMNRRKENRLGPLCPIGCVDGADSRLRLGRNRRGHPRTQRVERSSRDYRSR